MALEDFESDDDRATYLEDFGESITLFPGEPGETVIQAIWEESHRQDGMVDGTDPSFTAALADVVDADLDCGDSVQRAGADYTVRSIRPDGTGFVHVVVTAQ